MKIGMNLLLWTGHVTEAHFPLFERLKAIGFDGAEIPIFDTASAAHYRRIGQAARDAGLTLTAVSAFTAEDPLADSAAERDRASAHLARVTERAADAGVELLVGPLYQKLGQFTGSGPSGEEYARIAQAHRALTPVLKAAGVQVSLEPLNRFEAYLLNTVDQTLQYLSDLVEPAYGLLYDTFHANIEERDPIAALDAAWRSGQLNHVHISENDRGTPGRGHAKILPAIEHLRTRGYDGWLTIEAFSAAVPELVAATRVWRPLFPDPDQVCTEGYSLIRRAWDGA